MIFTIFVIFISGFCIWQYHLKNRVTPKQNTISSPKQEITQRPTPLPQKEKKVSFFFGGDLMFDRYVNHVFKDVGFEQIFANLDKNLFQQDIVFANLEGPISDQPINDDYQSGSMLFNMPTAALQGLKSTNINGVSLANNHTFNAGKSGFQTTQNLLQSASIKYGGSQTGFDENKVIHYDTEIPMSIIVYNNLAFQDLSKIEAAINLEKAAGRFVTVFPHWGNEYALKHNSHQETAAHQFVDAGADLIIGNHPHVVQDVEIYKNRPIFYSLGNFVFDQLFSKETQEGLLLTGELTKTGLTINLNPIKGEKMRLRLMNESEKQELLKRINAGQNQITINL
jgi:poly-gamma-glutamate synthesis protein (capsule biosynthesis protein)